MRRQNKILEDHGCWLLIDTSTRTIPNGTMKIDRDDWHSITTGVYSKSDGYNYTFHNGEDIAVHRLLNPEWRLTDHKNRDRSDNRRENLRPCTRAENAMNSKSYSTNRSGHRGVGWHKASNGWRARITIGGVLVRLGTFKRIEDAVHARQQAEREHYGEFAHERI